MVLYIFKIHGFWKLGVAKECAWKRFKEKGFWHLQHPKELCKRLSFADVELVHLFQGGLDEELAIKAAHPGDVGEFYTGDRYAEILSACAHLNALPLPPRPAAMNEHKNFRGCCLDLGHDRRQDHTLRSALTKGRRAPCKKCGKKLSIRTDKIEQHQRGRNCA